MKNHGFILELSLGHIHLPHTWKRHGVCCQTEIDQASVLFKLDCKVDDTYDLRKNEIVGTYLSVS